MGHVKIKRKEGLLFHTQTPVCTIVTSRQFEIGQVLKNNFPKAESAIYLCTIILVYLK